MRAKKISEGVIMVDLHINKKGWEFQWTPEEDKIIKENYTSKGYGELKFVWLAIPLALADG